MDNNERLKVVEVRTCVEEGCTNKFEIKAGEKAYYESKGLILPKRCPTCRMNRRSSIKTPLQIPLEPEA